MATLKWITSIKNIGIQHDLIVGCSLLQNGVEKVRFPWWVIFNVPSGNSWKVTVNVTGAPAGTYLGKCRAWTGYTPGNKIADLKDQEGNIVGAFYEATWEDLLEPPILDEETQNITIPSVGISADITEFSLTL